MMADLAGAASRAHFNASNIADAVSDWKRQRASMMADLAGAASRAHFNASNIADAVSDWKRQRASTMADLAGAASRVHFNASNIADALSDWRMRRASMMADLAGAASRAHFNASNIADAVSDWKMQRASMMADLAGVAGAVHGHSHQIHQMLRGIVFNHPALATAGVGRARHPGDRQSGIHKLSKWEEYLDYLFYFFPSITIEWIQNNPGKSVGYLLTVLAWVFPSPYEWGRDGSLGDNKYSKGEKVVVSSSIEVRRRPIYQSIITDTLYYNNRVERVREEDGWVKVEYRDQVEGKDASGWVPRHYLDRIEMEGH
jgi:hypothetical protein